MNIQDDVQKAVQIKLAGILKNIYIGDTWIDPDKEESLANIERGARFIAGGAGGVIGIPLGLAFANRNSATSTAARLGAAALGSMSLGGIYSRLGGISGAIGAKGLDLVGRGYRD